MWTDLRLTAFRWLILSWRRNYGADQSAVDCFLIGRYKLGRFLLCNDHETIVLRGAQPCPLAERAI